VDIKDLFGYNWYARRKFLKSTTEIPWEAIIESRGASFDCIRNIFVHSLQAEQSWIRFLHGKSTKEIWEIPFTKFADANAIREYADEVEAETNEYLKNLQEEMLEKVLNVKRRDGTIEQHTVEDILIHVVEEEIHHRGELLCIYWQLNIRPPYTSYMAYKRQISS
jgi:uncharacterized damage-inducible protein DinB